MQRALLRSTDHIRICKHRPRAILSFRAAPRILALKQHGLVLELRANKLTPDPPFSTLFSASFAQRWVKSPATEIHHGRVSWLSCALRLQGMATIAMDDGLIDLVTDSDLLFALSGIL